MKTRNKLRKRARSFRQIGLFLVLPLLLIDLWVGRALFNYTLYTNSLNMDPQIEHFEATSDWNFTVLGSSEVKWGISPSQINQNLEQKGIRANGFNLGLDGFSLSYYLAILPAIQLPKRLSHLKVALVGVNLTEEQQILPQDFDSGFSCDGILQRAVLSSAFAKDYGLYHLCHSSQWPEPLVRQIENLSNLVRYRQSLRTLLLGSTSSDDIVTLASNGLTQYPNGFYAHKSIQDNPEESAVDLQNFLDREKEEPQNFQPMAPEVWPALLAEEAFFEQWASYFNQHQIMPVFFALPTNPIMIDARNRRTTYQQNSQLMQDWAKNRSQPTVFLDLGIKDNYDPQRDYADYRHLSEAGAVRFSKELGRAIANQPSILSAFKTSQSLN